MYFAHAYSILSYGVTLMGATSDAQTVFKSQKSILLELLHTTIRNFLKLWATK